MGEGTLLYFIYLRQKGKKMFPNRICPSQQNASLLSSFQLKAGLTVILSNYSPHPSFHRRSKKVSAFDVGLKLNSEMSRRARLILHESQMIMHVFSNGNIPA